MGENGPVEPDLVEPDADVASARAAEVEELTGRVAELEDRWRRAVADLDNVRKRVARDAGQAQADERARVAAEWLPVVDNLERALEHSSADPETIVEGVRGVRDQAVAILERLGFPRHDDVGEPFDPAKHEAVGVVPGTSAPAGTVVHVVRPGYGDGERQLRPSAVIVAAGGQ
jgi:molecular chaperone GrpE